MKSRFIIKNCIMSIFVLEFFFSLYFPPIVQSRFYFEKFITISSKVPGIIYMIIKYLSIKNINPNIVFLFVIFLKNLIYSNLEKKLSIQIYLIISCLFDISTSYSTKIIDLLNQIILRLIDINYQDFSIFSLLFDKINEKISNKLLLKNRHEFFFSIISGFKLLILVFTENKKLLIFYEKNLEIIERAIFNLFLLIGKISQNLFNNIHLECIFLITELFRDINKYNLISDVADSLNEWLLIFLFILDNTRNRNSITLRIREKIFNVLIFLLFAYQSEFSLYLPLLYNIEFKNYDFNIRKINEYSLHLITAINTSINKIIFYKDTNFRHTVMSICEQLISNHIKISENLYYFPIFILSKEVLNFHRRIEYTSVLLNSIDTKKRIQFLNLCWTKNPSVNFFHCFLLQISPLVFYILFLIVNGSYNKGIYTTYPLTNFKFFCESAYIKLSEKKYASFIDYLSLFRYQLPIKNLKKIVTSFYNILCLDKSVNSHLLSGLERILGLRGNSEDVITIPFYDNIYNNNFFFTILQMLGESKYSYITQINVKKLFMRIIVNNLIFCKNYENGATKYVFSLFENLQKKKKNNFLSLYDFEIINLIVLSVKKNLDDYFLKNILHIGIFLISENQFDIFPYIIDNFTSLILYCSSGENLLILSNFFRSILNPHIWYFKNLVRPLLNFIKALISSEKFNFNDYEITSVCCIIKILLQQVIDTEFIFLFLFSFLQILKKNLNFVPHLIEMLLNNNKNLIRKQFNSYFYIFVITLVGKIGLNKTFELFNTIQKNYLFCFLEIFSFKFLYIDKHLDNEVVLLDFIEIFFYVVHQFSLLNLKKITGRMFRQIVFFLRIIGDDRLIVSLSNIRKQIRFKTSLQYDYKCLILNKTTFFLQKIKNIISLHLFNTFLL